MARAPPERPRAASQGPRPYNRAMDAPTPAQGAVRSAIDRDQPLEPAYRHLAAGAGMTLEEGLDQLAEAIRDATRRRILISFYSDPTPRTANEVADAQGISRPVARTHLEVLRATGYLRHEPRRGRRGKPAHLYTLDTQSPTWIPHPPRQMALLSLLVLQAASLGPERVVPLIEQVGHDYGTAIEEFRLRSQEPPHDLDQALAPLGVLGVGVELTADGRDAHLVLHSPLFREGSPGRPDLVAALHLGIVRALVRDLPLVVELDPAGADEDATRFRVRRRRSSVSRVAALAGATG